MDGYSGLLRIATPATKIINAIPKASLALGKTPTGLPVSPVPVPSTSTLAGLGRDSRIYHGGAPPYAGLWPVFSGHTTPNPVRDSH